VVVQTLIGAGGVGCLFTKMRPMSSAVFCSFNRTSTLSTSLSPSWSVNPEAKTRAAGLGPFLRRGRLHFLDLLPMGIGDYGFTGRDSQIDRVRCSDLHVVSVRRPSGRVADGGLGRRSEGVLREVIHARDRETLHEFIRENTSDDTEAYFTDDWMPYRGIGDEDTRHETVNHSIDEYARGNVNTNSVENIWSLLKRSIIGSFHKVSIKHLDAYLDELEWRFNNRDNPWLFRDTLIRLIQSDNVEYKELTA